MASVFVSRHYDSMTLILILSRLSHLYLGFCTMLVVNMHETYGRGVMVRIGLYLPSLNKSVCSSAS